MRARGAVCSVVPSLLSTSVAAGQQQVFRQVRSHVGMARGQLKGIVHSKFTHLLLTTMSMEALVTFFYLYNRSGVSGKL